MTMAGRNTAVPGRVCMNQAELSCRGPTSAKARHLHHDIQRRSTRPSINKNIDVVLGSRFIGNKTRRNIYLRTFFANKFLSLLFSILNRRKVTDVATCYKLIKSEIYQNIELTKNGFEYEIEILSKALEYSSDFAEVCVQKNPRHTTITQRPHRFTFLSSMEAHL